MSDRLNWTDIALHNAGAIAIGLIAAFTHPAFIAVNVWWLINELLQRRRKGQPWQHTFTGKQVLWEWVSPSVTGPVAMCVASAFA